MCPCAPPSCCRILSRPLARAFWLSCAPPLPRHLSIGERANVCLRIRPALTEEEGQDNNALSCDRVNRLAWALAGNEEGANDVAPRQYAFDEVLEQHVGQAEVFDIVGMQPVNAAINGKVGSVLCFGASGAGKDFSLRCERPGQEGLLLRALSLIFSGSASLIPQSARAAPEVNSDIKVNLAYLLLTADQTVHDLLSQSTLDGPWPAALERLEDSGHQAICEDAYWESAGSPAEVMRLLARADAARSESQPREGT